VPTSRVGPAPHGMSARRTRSARDRVAVAILVIPARGLGVSRIGLPCPCGLNDASRLALGRRSIPCHKHLPLPPGTHAWVDPSWCRLMPGTEGTVAAGAAPNARALAPQALRPVPSSWSRDRRGARRVRSASVRIHRCRRADRASPRLSRTSGRMLARVSLASRAGTPEPGQSTGDKNRTDLVLPTETTVPPSYDLTVE
jgi:hypothetical protein